MNGKATSVLFASAFPSLGGFLPFIQISWPLSAYGGNQIEGDFAVT